MYEEAKLVVVTDAEIFGRYKVQRPRRLKSPHAQAARSALDIDFTEFEEGDYVVHLQHGIGRYLGLKVLPIAAGRKTCRSRRAAGGRRPGMPRDRIRAERSGAGRAETLCAGDRGASGQQIRRRGQGASAAEHAGRHALGQGQGAGGTRGARRGRANCSRIQAARESQPGHAFAPDNPWQREFESAFLYEETPDQMRAIVETKADMERPKPMDRLICGDVGFGKTEVAIRAAFKAVMDGRQVAVLVPTTVLAQQHFNTFRERMADYPVRIELLSRFRTPREAQACGAGPAGGRGGHRHRHAPAAAE